MSGRLLKPLVVFALKLVPLAIVALVLRTKGAHTDEKARPATLALAARIVNFGPLTLALVACIVLFYPAQSREIYIDLIKERDWLRGSLGLGTIMLFGLLLHAWNTTLVGSRINLVYPDHISLTIDRQLKAVQSLKARVCAVLPLTGVLIGLLIVLVDVYHASQFLGLGESSIWSDGAIVDYDLPAALINVSWQLFGAAIFVAGFTVLLLWFLGRIADVRRLNGLGWYLGALIFALPLVIGVDPFVIGARFLGPLGSIGFTLIALMCFVRVLLIMMRQAFMIATQGLLLSTRVFGGWKLVLTTAIIASAMLGRTGFFLLHPPKIDPPAPSRSQVAAGEQGMIRQFDLWLDLRLERWSKSLELQNKSQTAGGSTRDKPMPIFVVAAPGGGIYAASSAMTFLAGIEDACDHFGQQVFAISSVSGGSIGAAVFQGLTQRPLLQVPIACREVASTLNSAAVTAIATGDHLSPLLMSTPFDWLEKLMPWVGFDRRSIALTASFVRSYNDAPKALARSLLTDPFAKHWSASTTAPALVVNATSVETGFRLAFAPFSLLNTGDGTLIAINDLNRNVKFTEDSKSKLGKLRVIDAAVTSARFPGILPAWPLSHRGPVTSASNAEIPDRQLNLVDGGYADSSGATTAVDMFKELRKRVGQRGLANRVNLRLILLTDNETQTEFASSGGTNFRDIVAPITALLSVRQLQATRAVTRAVNEIDAEELIKVQLDHRIFPLPLGWKISTLTNDIIRVMLGAARYCPSSALSLTSGSAVPSNPDLFLDVVRDNSCSQARILRLLDPVR